MGMPYGITSRVNEIMRLGKERERMNQRKAKPEEISAITQRIEDLRQQLAAREGEAHYGNPVHRATYAVQARPK